MKLRDLKEWGGRDLPGPGDEATWGGRTPYGDEDDQRADLGEYLKNNFVSTADAPDDAFFINIGWFHMNDTEKEINENLKGLGLKVANDTGHAYASAFLHAIKPMWDFCCGNTDHYLTHDKVRSLQELTAQMGKSFSITEMKAGVKKWMSIAQDGATTLDDIASSMND